MPNDTSQVKPNQSPLTLLSINRGSQENDLVTVQE